MLIVNSNPITMAFNKDNIRDQLNSFDPIPRIKTFEELENSLPNSEGKLLADLEASLEGENSEELIKANDEMFNELVSKMNDKYGLSIEADFTSFKSTMGFMSDPDNKIIVELYLSETYGRFRVAIYYKMMQAIALLSEQVLDPKFLLSSAIDIEGKFDMMERLFGFMNSVEEVWEKLEIKASDKKLSRMNSGSRTIDRTNPEVLKFLDDLNKEVDE